MNAKQNKTEINLISAGTGVIFFGLWSFIKTALSFLFLGIDNYISVPEGQSKALVIILTWVFAALIALLYFYVGFTARGEGKGKSKRVFYLVLTGLMLFFRTMLIIFEFAMVIFLSEDKFSMIISVIVDATAFIMLLEVMINSIRLRGMRKQQTAEEGAYEL